MNRKESSSVLWFTGLSGAGKTTLARAIRDKLNLLNVSVIHLDGDDIRSKTPGLGFSKEDRIQNIKNVVSLVKNYQAQGFVVVCSFISPYKVSRQFVKENVHNYFEIYVSTPLELCESRDSKGLYKKCREGKIQNFTGINDPYEIPEQPDVVVDCTNIEVSQAVEIILNTTIGPIYEPSLKRT